LRDETVHLLALDGIPSCSVSAAIWSWLVMLAVDAVIVRRRLSR
jgi:hypothetical protein